jgi:pimeloyl-ACP methyl ester carboxylesterase
MTNLRFGDCELDLRAFELRRDGRPCAIEPQVFELLAHLARNPGRLITKDELIAEVWGGRIGSDAALASRIKAHCREDAAVPFEQGREFAAGIPGARFVALEGRNHLFLENEPAFPRFMAELRAFLGAPES